MTDNVADHNPILPRTSDTPAAKASRITGWALSGLLIAFLTFDGAIKLVPLQIVLDTSAALGLPADPTSARILGILTLGCTLLYAIPRTAILGAILLTAYLGGAIATHFSAGSPLFTHLLFGVYLGLIAWGGLWFRDPRVRAMIPFRA